MINSIKAKAIDLFKSDTIILVTGILSILPFFIISFFNHPTSDDFWYFSKSQNFGFWNAQISWYQEWSGRYFSTAVLSLYPLITKSFFLYKIIPVILLMSLFYSIYYLSSLLLMNLRKKDFIILTFLLITLYLIQMPSVCQGFYWLAGSITYQLSNILVILLFSFLIKLIVTEKRIYLIPIILLVFFVVGSNETTMLLVDFLLVVVCIYNLYTNKKINYSLLVVLTFAVLFTIIVVKSPGNIVRAGEYSTKHQIIYAVSKAIMAAKSYLVIWLPIMIVFTFIYYDYLNKKNQLQSNKIFDINPILVFVIVCCIPFIGFFVSYWSIGCVPPLRTINTIYLFFILGFMYLTFVLFFKLKNIGKQFIVFSPWVKYLLYVVFFIYLGRNNNIKTAYSDLLSGTAFKYDLELKKRYRLIENSVVDTCYVPKLSNLPVTIFAGDITSDFKDWRNKGYDNFWKKTVVIKK